jgi:predicted nicotinamide N-methyase
VEDPKENGTHVCMLDWSTFTEKDVDTYDIDMILAADVIYDVTVIEMLVNVVDLCFKKRDILCYFVATKRNEKTMDFFRENCEKRGLFLKIVTNEFSVQEVFDYERQNISIVQILRRLSQ